jgi:anaerobic selenocysteine-containing dehydrogenase
MAMYHSWDSQNAWLRQIHGENYLFMNPLMARGNGIEDGGWIYVESPWGKVRCMARYSDLERYRQGSGGVEPWARCQRIAARLPAQPPDHR